MLLFAGVVSDSPQCPLCRVGITGYHQVPATSVTETVSTPPTSPDQPPVERAASVEEFISPDILNMLRRTYNEPSPNRMGQLLRQLQELRSSQQFLSTDFAWDGHEVDEPYALPDTGAKDGLCEGGLFMLAPGPQHMVISGLAVNFQNAALSVALALIHNSQMI